MENKPDPGGEDNRAVFITIWLLVGLAPIPILLAAVPANGGRPAWSWVDPMALFLFCATCNLVGGIGCLRYLRDPAARIFLGVLLGAFFFLLSWGIVVFQACSHMNI
jgi:hypothetical protein